MPETIYECAVDAAELATAWLNVANAWSDDKELPMYYRAVSFEFTDDRALVLASTDATVFLYAEVGERGQLGQVPEHQAVVKDTVGKGRMTALMKHVRDMATKAEKEDRDYDVTAYLTVMQAPHEIGGLLGFEGLAPTTVRVRVGDERLTLPTWEGQWPGWRTILAGFRPGARTNLMLDAGKLLRLSKFVGGSPGEPVAVGVQLHEARDDGRDNVARVVAATTPLTVGLVSTSAAVLDGEFVPNLHETDGSDADSPDTSPSAGGAQVVSIRRDELDGEMAMAGAVHSDPDD